MKTSRAERYRRRLPVRFGEGTTLLGSGFTSNVSVRGLSIASLSPATSGALLDIEAKLPDGRLARIKGRVRWVHNGSARLNIPNVYGIALTTADPAWFEFVAETTNPTRTQPPPASASTPPPAQPAPKAAAPAKSGMDTDVGRPRLRRMRIAVPVRFGPDAKMELRGTTLDVSASGLSIASPNVQAALTSLHLLVEFETGGVHVEGVVVRARRMSPTERIPNSFAVRLVRADEGWYREIQRLHGIL